MKKEVKKWGFSLVLTVPILFFLSAYFFNHSKDAIPTGFIQYDNVSYAANAQQLFKNGNLFYANRLNDSDHYPRIYFQPQHLILAGLMKAGFAPGLAFCFFSCIFSLIFFRTLILLYDHLYPLSKHPTLVMILFSWGGGMLALSGWLLYLLHILPGKNIQAASLALDPAAGWWGLNLGRSLFFSMESYYHFLFFAGVYLIVKKKWLPATIGAVILSLSHPFTGLEFLSILCLWLILEKILFKNATIPAGFVFFILALTAFHAWYYLVYLNHFPEHRIIFSQYQLNWRLRFYNIFPAYIIVAALAVISFLKTPLTTSENTRLFICWALVAFVLANHELIIKPMQPLHFTRGYIWAPLFLLGIPAVESLISFLIKNIRVKIILAIGIILFLLDNINWIYLNSRYTSSKSSISFIDLQQKSILEYLNKNTGINTLIIGSDECLPYLSTLYTQASPWISHVYNTPFYDQKLQAYNAYLKSGARPAGWMHRELVFIVDKKNAAEMSRYAAVVSFVPKIYETADYLLYRDGSVK
jgi:hypothetical protein